MTASMLKSALRVTASAVVLAMLAGCATPPPAEDAEAMTEWEQMNDPLEPMNRAIFDFNQVVDAALIKPAAQGYRAAVPEFGRERVHDFLVNLRAPWTFANDLLQGEFDRAGETLGRFAMNTTFGVAGIMDVAAEAGLPAHEEDFGQTLAVWGVEEGPYIVLPIFGPSTLRDTGGMAVDWYADPVNIVLREESLDWAQWTRGGLTGLDTRERYLDVLDEVERTSLDYYSSLRSLYRQRRNAEIKNGADVEAIPAPGMSSTTLPNQVSLAK